MMTDSIGDDAALGKDIRFAAMNLLARREYSHRELQTKLIQRFNIDDEQAAERLQRVLRQQLERLEQQGLQSDSRFCESFINSSVAKGRGPRRIVQELRQKGVEGELAESHLQPYKERWYDLAAELYRRKFGEPASLDNKEKARRVRFMQYRGFSYEHFDYLLES